MQRRLRYIIEVSACMAAASWLTVELTGQAEDGFAPPESSTHWCWSDLTVQSSPSENAREVAQIERGASLQVIRRSDGWAAIIDTLAPRVVGFIPDSALHPQRFPTFARAYAQAGAVIDSLRAGSLWVHIEDPSTLRHLSNGKFEAVGAFPSSQGEPRQYSLLLQYTADNSWKAVSLTIEHVAH